MRTYPGARERKGWTEKRKRQERRWRDREEQRMEIRARGVREKERGERKSTFRCRAIS